MCPQKTLLFQDKLIIPDLCFICEESTPTIQFNPCGHLICCSSCAKLTKKCPKCRQPIKSKDNMKSIGDLRASSLRQSKKTNSDPKIAKNLNNNRSKNQDTALKSLQAKYDVSNILNTPFSRVDIVQRVYISNSLVIGTYLKGIFVFD